MRFQRGILFSFFPVINVLASLGREQQPLINVHNNTFDSPLHHNVFECYISGILEEFHTPGMAIAIVNGNQTWSRGFGYSQLRPKEKVTPHTLFLTGSTTKSFTAAAVSKLVCPDDSESGHINWSTTLASLIRDDFVLQDEYAMNHITLVDAMSHRTGMPRHDMSWINGNPSVREQVRQLRYLPLHRELRVEWEYCNLMFTAVSHAIETVAGIGMKKILQDWIWEPLGMIETFYDIEDALERQKQSKDGVRLARGHLWDNDTQSYVEVPWSDIPPSNGAGGVISNVCDYTRWIRQFLHPERSTNAISVAAIKEMTGAHMVVRSSGLPYPFYSYGLGLEIASYRGQVLVGHSGVIGGYMAAMYWLPEHDWGFVALQNSYSLAGLVVQFKLIDDYLDGCGIQGERFDARHAARKVERDAAERFKNGRQVVYPGAPDLAPVGPALPLQAYEGTYHHPAYGNLTLRMSASSAAGALPGAPVPLVATGSDKSYLDMSWTFHHVSGENWWVRVRTGPGYLLEDELLKAKFAVDIKGKVSGLGLQAEGAIDQLAWFEKLC